MSWIGKAQQASIDAVAAMPSVTGRAGKKIFPA
jgi:hypothetical protein